MEIRNKNKFVSGRSHQHHHAVEFSLMSTGAIYYMNEDNTMVHPECIRVSLRRVSQLSYE